MDVLSDNWPAISGGALVVLGGIYAILAAIAPKTKTKVDDKMRDGLGFVLNLLRVGKGKK